MSKLGQDTLVAYLAGDTEALTYLVREGLPIDVVPDKLLHPVVEWAIEHLGRYGKAPSIPAMKDRWGTLLAEREIDIEVEPEDTVESALDDLKDDYVRKVGVYELREAVKALVQAPKEDRREVFGRRVAELAAIDLGLQSRTVKVDIRDAAETMWAEYQRVKATGNPVRGMTFGLDEVDAWTRGIWPGEMCVIAAPPKMGKSWMANFITYKAWDREQPTGIYTLENSIEMATQRVAAIACGVDVLGVMDGTLGPEDEDRIQTWIHEDLRRNDVPLLIMNPDSAGRTPESIVQSARANGLANLVVDQLTHMEYARPQERLNRPTEIKEIAEGLRLGISTGRHRLSCVLIHQVNREGLKHFRATGRVEMDQLAEGAIERTADLALALTATEVQRRTARVTLQCLAARRVPPQDFELNWMPEVGSVSVIGGVTEL